MRDRPALAAVLAIDLVALRMLHALGSEPWARLSPGSPPEDVVAATARLLALALGWWLLGSTVAYAGVRRVVGAGGPSRLVGRLTLPAVRRLVEGALVASLTVGAALPAAADRAVPPVVRIERDTGGDHVLPPVVAPPAVQPPGIAPPAPPPPPQRPRTAAHDDRHVVRTGEHLWSIAAATVGAGPPQEIGRYWRRLVAANRDRIRAGDPDLIFPGEVLRLPPR